MIAKVIVDVPAKQTNRAFDYFIPLHLQPWLDIGSRVAVSFGSRLLQGFVVDIQEQTDLDVTTLKEVVEVLDVTPPLTKELVELATWMSRTYVCPEVITLQAMLPRALKAKYERHVQCNPHAWQNIAEYDVLQQMIMQFITSKSVVKMEALLRQFPHESAVVKQMIVTGMLIEEQMIKDQLARKTIHVVTCSVPWDDLPAIIEQLSSKARKQREVLTYFLTHQQDIPMSELTQKLKASASTIHSLADAHYLQVKEMEVQRDPYAHREFPYMPPQTLTEEQQKVFEPIQQQLWAQKFKVFLLYGVTGSGKTEVYLQAIQICLDLNQQAIMLVPEISLTPQMVERFKGRFGDKVAVWHSRLSAGERYDEWRKIRRNQVDIVIGARSAIFAPFQHIGLIVIDEEHEATYKQEDSPKYHTRDVAIKRAQAHQASVILGSATPSLESIYQAKLAVAQAPAIKPSSHAPEPLAPVILSQLANKQPYTLLTLHSRVENRPLPYVHVVDMRTELKDGNRSMFSRPLHRAIEARLARQEQTILLLNRRGYATFVMCRSCGFVCNCPNCEVSLTYHQVNQSLRCHYCGYAEQMVSACPQCASEHIRHFGTGTQRVEEELSRLFPGIRIIRMDVDTTNEKGAHEKWLTKFARREADVLLGTQMVAKGLDFPDVTLVGVIAADSSLNIPDFRSSERTFQLLTQVAGRAGRHHKEGEVFIQTYSPEHYIIQSASQHDYRAFARQELNLRSKLHYPPYCRLVLITLSHEQVDFLVKIAHAFAKRLIELTLPQHPTEQEHVEVLGPVASPLSRIKDRYRFQCVVKYAGESNKAALVMEAIATATQFFEDQMQRQKLQIHVDVDPQFLM